MPQPHGTDHLVCNAFGPDNAFARVSHLKPPENSGSDVVLVCRYLFVDRLQERIDVFEFLFGAER